MRWSLNSAEPKKASSLSEHLHAELDHFCATQPSSWARQLVSDWEPSQDDLRMLGAVGITARQNAIVEARAKVAADIEAKLPGVRAHASAAIASVSSVASAMGGADALYLVTLSGESKSTDLLGRISISIDAVA